MGGNFYQTIQRVLQLILGLAFTVSAGWASATEINYGANSVSVKSKWEVDQSLSHDKVASAFESAMQESQVFSALTKAAPAKKVVEVKDDGRRAIQERRFYFIKSKYQPIPEAMVSFFINTMECFKSTKKDCKSSSTVTLVDPLKLYESHTMFGQKSLSAKDMIFHLSFTQKKKKWVLRQGFSISNLLMLQWVAQMADRMGIKEKPDMHKTLLAMGQFVSGLNVRVQKNLKAN